MPSATAPRISQGANSSVRVAGTVRPVAVAAGPLPMADQQEADRRGGHCDDRSHGGEEHPETAPTSREVASWTVSNLPRSPRDSP